MRMGYRRLIIEVAMEVEFDWMKVCKLFDVWESGKIELGGRILSMSRRISEGRSQSVAVCFVECFFWWRFFCKRSRRFDRRGRVAVVSINGSSGISCLRVGILLLCEWRMNCRVVMRMKSFLRRYRAGLRHTRD